MTAVLKQLGEIGIIPAVEIEDTEHALSLAGALAAGGLPCAQVCLDAGQGEEAIRRITAGAPGFLVGAGGVLTLEQADRAAAAGARFVTSPAYSPELIAHCSKIGLPVVPRCADAGEAARALAAGLETVGFLPNQGRDGFARLWELAEQYPGLTFLPDGVENADLGAYLAYDRVLYCAAYSLVPTDSIAAGRFDEITALCAAAVSAMHGFALAHVGVNAQDEAEAQRCAELLAMMLGCSTRDAGKAVFTGEMVEWMKGPGAGRHGHIGFYANRVDRAMADLARKGFTSDPAREMRDAANRLTFCYLREEICGFAIHLMERGPRG